MRKLHEFSLDIVVPEMIQKDQHRNGRKQRRKEEEEEKKLEQIPITKDIYI